MATAVTNVDGRPTAQRVDAYLTLKAKNCGGASASDIVTFRGTRVP